MSTNPPGSSTALDSKPDRVPNLDAPSLPKPSLGNLEPDATTKSSPVDPLTIVIPTKEAAPMLVKTGGTPTPEMIDRWIGFGFTAGVEPGTYVLPEAVVAFETNDLEGHSKRVELLKTMAVPPLLAIRIGDRNQVLFRLATPELAETLARNVPQGVIFSAPGGTIALPNDEEWSPSETSARSAADLSELNADDVGKTLQSDPAPSIITTTPLTQYSLLGQSAAFREKAIDATPLLSDLCLSGQVTSWYAAPNAGKTLIALNLLIEAVKAGRIAGANAYYVNADDGSDGMATKMELMDDIGVHTLTPGFRGFKADDFVPLLLEMAQRDEARGVLVVVDTTKKFTSLMDKKLASAYGTACRHVAMRGGAVLNLAHVNKAPKADGSPQFAGTTDLVEDCDAAYIIMPLDVSSSPGERVVQFHNFKRRGNSAGLVAYGYAAEDGVSYAERLSSVRRIDLDTLDEFKRVELQRTDEDVIAIIAACIADGHNTKMVLGKEAAVRAEISGREAYRVLERYTGNDTLQHRWQFKTQARGAKVYELLHPPPD